MFGRLRRRPSALEPESRWTVVVDPERIVVRDEAGESRSIARSDLCRVAIETNDSGPWGMDLWWLLFGSGVRPACAFPQGARGEQAAIDCLTALPGFDRSEMGRAMTSTDNALFTVWTRPGEPADRA